MLTRVAAWWQDVRDRYQHPDPLERAMLQDRRRRAAIARLCRRPRP